MRFVHFLVVSATLAASVTAAACGTFDLALESDTSNDATTSGGGGFSDPDAGTDAPEDGMQTFNPEAPYAALCGNGCSPGGDPADCAPGGNPGMDGSAPQVEFCQLVLNDDVAVPVCQPVGTFESGSVCTSVTDCAQDLGCAASSAGSTGTCRQYCCGNTELCPSKTYCSPQPMQDAVGLVDPVVEIPVCIPATNCELLNDASCDPGLTCTIVRADATTSCVEPGPGELGDPCPNPGCSAGYVCSLLTYQCKKLCRIDNEAADCGPEGQCQGGSMSFPQGFGICVGGSI